MQESGLIHVALGHLLQGLLNHSHRLGFHPSSFKGAVGVQIGTSPSSAAVKQLFLFSLFFFLSDDLRDHQVQQST